MAEPAPIDERLVADILEQLKVAELDMARLMRSCTADRLKVARHLAHMRGVGLIAYVDPQAEVKTYRVAGKPMVESLEPTSTPAPAPEKIPTKLDSYRDSSRHTTTVAVLAFLNQVEPFGANAAEIAAAHPDRLKQSLYTACSNLKQRGAITCDNGVYRLVKAAAATSPPVVVETPAPLPAEPAPTETPAPQPVLTKPPEKMTDGEFAAWVRTTPAPVPPTESQSFPLQIRLQVSVGLVLPGGRSLELEPGEVLAIAAWADAHRVALEEAVAS